MSFCHHHHKKRLWLTEVTRRASSRPRPPPTPQPPENEMKPLPPTCRPLRIKNCRFKILGPHYFQGRNTDADTEWTHADSVGKEAGRDESGSSTDVYTLLLLLLLRCFSHV